jgi:hypothetical protein
MDCVGDDMSPFGDEDDGASLVGVSTSAHPLG